MESIVTSAIEKGPRPYQEDRHYETYIPERGWQLMTVMDGHGGAEVSEFCEENIFRMIPLDAKNPELALRALIANLNSVTFRQRSGSTFSGVIISERARTVSVAILGDSPVVVLDERGKIHLSPEHNVRSNIVERKAAEQRGGIYNGGYIWNDLSSLGQGLQMSRALGDVGLDRILSREPEVYTIEKPTWVLVASDGIFDPGHSDTERLLEEVGQYAERNASADEIMKWATGRGLHDNATAVVWSIG